MSAEPLRNRAETAGLLSELADKPRSSGVDVRLGDAGAAFMGHLVAEYPGHLAIAFTPAGRGIGYATADSVPLVVGDAIHAAGTDMAQQQLTEALTRWNRDNRPGLSGLTPRFTPHDNGWRVSPETAPATR